MVRAAALLALASCLAQVDGQLILPFTGITQNLRGGSFTSYSKTWVFHGDHHHEQEQRTESYDLEDGRHIEKRSNCRDGDCQQLVSVQPTATLSKQGLFYKALMDFMRPAPQQEEREGRLSSGTLQNMHTPPPFFLRDPRIMVHHVEAAPQSKTISFETFMIPYAVISLALVGMCVGVAVSAYANRPQQRAPAKKLDEEMAMPLASADHTRVAPLAVAQRSARQVVPVPAVTAKALLQDIYSKALRQESLAVSKYVRSLYARASA